MPPNPDGYVNCIFNPPEHTHYLGAILLDTDIFWSATGHEMWLTIV